MREWTYVGSHGEWNPCRNLLLEFLNLEIENLMLARALGWSRGVLGKIFEDGECGHGEDVFLLHQPHRLFAQLVGVIDRSHARLSRIERSRFSGCMHGNMPAQSR